MNPIESSRGTGDAADQAPRRRSRFARGRVTRRNLAYSIVDGSGFSFMTGIGENFFPAFVLALGMSEMAAGLVATVPMVVGAVFQLVASAAVRRLGSYKAWVVITAGLQALCFVPMTITAAMGITPGWLVFLIASVYWFGGFSGGAAWHTWIAMNVPTPTRSRYFGHRNRFLQVALLAGLLAGGLALKELIPEWGVRSYAVLFAAAALARIVSTAYLALQSEPRPLPIRQRSVGTRELARRAMHGPDGRLILYLVSMSVALQVAQPFLNPFMLVHIGLEEDLYALMLAAPLLGRAIAMPHLGALAQRRGARHVLMIGGVGLIPFAANWLVTDSVVFLFATQLVSGAFWAAHELGLFLMLLDTTRPEERTSVIAKYQLLNSLAMGCGTLLGALGLHLLDSSWTAYAVVFGASTLLRLAAMPLLLRTHPGSAHAPHVELQTMAVRPSGEAIDEPIVATLPDSRGDWNDRPR
jgi:MFS family permease